MYNRLKQIQILFQQSEKETPRKKPLEYLNHHLLQRPEMRQLYMKNIKILSGIQC